MADQQLSDQHRRMALARLDQLAAELGQLATWLDSGGEDQVAELADYAARELAAAALLLGAPLRRRVTPARRAGP